ncbi:MAG: hypothetical protein NVS9B1_22160 [Candidatus Dormibacteraceae bacterium]
MIQLLRAVYLITAAAFVLLALATVADWVRHRGRARAMLALALGFLALVAAGGRVPDLTGYRGPLIRVVLVAAFMASGYFVLLFRDAFIPLDRRWRTGAAGLTALAILLGVLPLLPGLAQEERPFQPAVTVFIIGTWALLVGEAIWRFWVAARGKPRVQRLRMRALTVGFAGLILILVVSGAGGTASQTVAVQLASQLLALAMVPVILVSFAPPTWLRRQWRVREEVALQRAVQDLLLFSPDTKILAERAVGWAIRLVGAEGAFIQDGNGQLLAAAGMDEAAVDSIMASRGGATDGRLLQLPGTPSRSAIVTTLPLEMGPAVMGVLAGPFTPVFGTDEIVQLEAYATSVAAGMERTRVTERITAMEKSKSQFLNLASHELRGPLTVLRGYISMLESGVFGELNAKGLRALPVMNGKAIEMNSLVEQMIEAARLEDGRLQLRLEEVDLRVVVESAVESVQPLVDAGHPLVLDLPAEEVPAVVDRERILTILTNLIDNAVKYSPGGGEVHCQLRIKGGAAEVEVVDQGLGVAAADLPILFTRFGRVTTPETQSIGGTGLGLYLAQELARMHGGDLVVQSRPGAGSTFTLKVPIAVSPNGH